MSNKSSQGPHYNRSRVVALGAIFIILVIVINFIGLVMDKSIDKEMISADEIKSQWRSSVREITIIPRYATACNLPYKYAIYRGNKNKRHGWLVRFNTIYTCVDCPVGPDCSPGIYSFSALVQESGIVTDNEFVTILSAAPGDESEQCDGFDNYVIRWEEAPQLKKPECGKMYNYRIQYPIKVTVEPRDLTAYSGDDNDTKCSELVFCNLQSNRISIDVNRNDSRRREIVIPFRGKE